MANPFSKGWKYVMASFDQKIDEHADPKVQIQQAVAAAKKQHQDITDQAAEVMGNKTQLEMRLGRLLKNQNDLQDQARRALELADASSDPTTAQEYSNAAEVLAAQLVGVEQELEHVKIQHEGAVQAAKQAEQQQKESAARLKEQLAHVDELLMQADQAAMQEQTTAALSDFSPDDTTPTLDAVRAKIEKRYTNALGAQELYQTHVNDAITAGDDTRAASRLEEIRAAMKENKELEQ
ncbi:MAG: PspA/IM30 family protein [Corynebacterium sp.]|nr:PspA/IM30 family protein [Corynebacterium sp.]